MLKNHEISQRILNKTERLKELRDDIKKWNPKLKAGIFNRICNIMKNLEKELQEGDPQLTTCIATAKNLSNVFYVWPIQYITASLLRDVRDLQKFLTENEGKPRATKFQEFPYLNKKILVKISEIKGLCNDSMRVPKNIFNDIYDFIEDLEIELYKNDPKWSTCYNTIGQLRYLKKIWPWPVDNIVNSLIRDILELRKTLKCD